MKETIASILCCFGLVFIRILPGAFLCGATRLVAEPAQPDPVPSVTNSPVTPPADAKVERERFARILPSLYWHVSDAAFREMTKLGGQLVTHEEFVKANRADIESVNAIKLQGQDAAIVRIRLQDPTAPVEYWVFEFLQQGREWRAGTGYKYFGERRAFDLYADDFAMPSMRPYFVKALHAYSDGKDISSVFSQAPREKQSGAEPAAEKIHSFTTAEWEDVLAHGPDTKLQAMLAAEPDALQRVKISQCESPLVYVAARRTPSLRILLARGASVQATDKFGATPLHCAASWSTYESAKLLIGSGAKVNARDNRHRTPLHEAADQGSLEIAKLLLEHGAEVNAAMVYGATPLHDAAWRGHTNVMALLISRGADVNAPGSKGLTPLHDAARQRHQDAVRLLLEHGADVNRRSEEGYTVLDWQADPLPDGEIMRLLRDKGARRNRSLNAWGAAATGDLDTVRAYVVETPDAVRKGTEITDTTLLHYAAIGGDKAVVEFLLDKGARLEARNTDGFTPLHCAAEAGQREIVEILLARQADAGARTAEGETPMSLAAKFGHGDVVDALKSHGARE